MSTASSDRRWFPAPDFFIAADFDDAPVIDRSPRPIRAAISKCQSDLILERRMLVREAGFPTPRPGVVRTVNERIARITADLDKLLTSLVYHEETWAHLAADCLICDRSVSL